MMVYQTINQGYLTRNKEGFNCNYLSRIPKEHGDVQQQVTFEVYQNIMLVSSLSIQNGPLPTNQQLLDCLNDMVLPNK
jgi:hypothetical protein